MTFQFPLFTVCHLTMTPTFLMYYMSLKNIVVYLQAFCTSHQKKQTPTASHQENQAIITWNRCCCLIAFGKCNKLKLKELIAEKLIQYWSQTNKRSVTQGTNVMEIYLISCKNI